MGEVDIGNLGRWALGSTAYMSYVVSLARAERAVEVQRLVSQLCKQKGFKANGSNKIMAAALQASMV